MQFETSGLFSAQSFSQGICNSLFKLFFLLHFQVERSMCLWFKNTGICMWLLNHKHIYIVIRIQPSELGREGGFPHQWHTHSVWTAMIRWMLLNETPWLSPGWLWHCSSTGYLFAWFQKGNLSSDTAVSLPRLVMVRTAGGGENNYFYFSAVISLDQGHCWALKIVHSRQKMWWLWHETFMMIAVEGAMQDHTKRESSRDGQLIRSVSSLGVDWEWNLFSNQC